MSCVLTANWLDLGLISDQAGLPKPYGSPVAQRSPLPIILLEIVLIPFSNRQRSCDISIFQIWVTPACFVNRLCKQILRLLKAPRFTRFSHVANRLRKLCDAIVLGHFGIFQHLARRAVWRRQK